MKPTLRLSGAIALLCFVVQVNAQTLASFNFDAATNYLTANSFDAASLSMAPMITYGSGVVNAGQQTTGGCSSTNTATTTGYEPAFDANDYIEFTLTPAPGKSISITSLILNLRTNGTGPTSYALRSSDDAFAANILSGDNAISQSGCQNLTLNINYNSATPITFRVYFYAAGNGSGEVHLDAITINGSNVVLPVKLVSFNAAKSGSSNKLVWNVADETNLVNYTVERSSDARNYVALGKVTATGSHSYSFTDAKPAGINYYRLVVTERSGATSRGKVVSLVNENNGLAMQMLPTLVNSNATVAVSLQQAGAINITISDMQGRMVMRTRTLLQQTSANIPLELSTLKAGAYNLQVETESGKKQTLRFVKQ